VTDRETQPDQRDQRPHLVAIVPEEIAGDATTAESIALRLGESMVVQVGDRSEAGAEVLAEQEDDQA
jgi:hypothetical protein